MYDPLGLSIGTTTLVAACTGSPPVARRAVLTLYPHCAPKVGVPAEDSGLIEPGMLMSGFVERIGDSVALVSSDGSSHDPDLLMVEALDAMVVAAGADSGSSEISIAVPAYWKPAKIQALRDGLRTHVGFVRSGMAPRLVSDAVASLTAVNSELDLPGGGVVGLLDFGGGGTSATLLETEGDIEPVSATMRCVDFSGDEIDHALLLRVFEELGRGSGIDPASTGGVGQLAQLRDNCRAAKERLSTDAATELAGELGGRRCNMQVTRHELEDLIQDRLSSFIYAFDDMLRRNRKCWADLSAVVAVGGGASIPLVTQRLSAHGRTPVLTVSQPALAAATGALALASRGEALDMRTRTSIGLLTAAAGSPGSNVIELPAGDVLVIDHDAATDRELAWSQTEFPGDVPVRFAGDSYNEDGPTSWSMRLNVIEPRKGRTWRRVRLSQLIIGLCALVAMTAIGGVAYTLTGIENHQAPVVPTVAPVPVPPPSSAVPSPVPPPPSPAPVPSVAPVPSSAPPPPPPPPPPVVVTPAPPPVVVTPAPPPVVTRTPPPPPPATTAMTTTPPPPPPPTTTTPPPPPPTTTTTVPMTTEWIHVPLLPVPIPIPVPANQAPPNPAPQYPQYPQYPQQYPGGGYPQNPFSGPGY
jgi:hypothetical protein